MWPNNDSNIFLQKKYAFGSARARDSEDEHKNGSRMIILHWFLLGIRHVPEKVLIFIAVRPVGALGVPRRRTAPYGPVRARMAVLAHTGSPPKGSLGRASDILYKE